MVHPAWLFVAATVIAVFGILFSFKKLIVQVQTKIENGKEITIEAFQQEQTRFFINVAIVETIPILLMVYGFAQMEQLSVRINIFLHLLIIVIVLIIALVNVFIIRRDTLSYGEPSKEGKNTVNTFMFIAIALLSAIPTVSVIALLIMNT